MKERWRDFNIDELFGYLAEDGIEEVSEHPNEKHAYNEIGVQYTALQQYDKALAWFRQASDRNSSSANYNIGRAYEVGLGVPKNPYVALDWYIKAAIQKYADASVAIGNIFLHGTGVPVNKYLALEWFYKSGRTDSINNMRYTDIGKMNKNKSLSQLVNETEEIYRAQRDAATVTLMENVSKLNKEINANKTKMKEKDDQIETLKRDIQKLDPNAYHSDEEDNEKLISEYYRSKQTVESLEKKLLAADEGIKSLKEEYEDLYKGSLHDSLHIDDQNKLLKDSNDTLKQKLNDSNDSVNTLQLEKTLLQQKRNRRMEGNVELENTLRSMLQSKGDEIGLLKQNTKLELNRAKLRNATIESVNRKLKYKIQRSTKVDDDIYTNETTSSSIGIKRELKEQDVDWKIKRER